MEDDTRQLISNGLAALARGDRSAVRPTFEILWPIVRAFCSRYLNHGPEVEDVAQNAIIKIFARASGFDATRDGLTWALTIAVWECRTEAQRTRRRLAADAQLGKKGDAVSESLSPEEETILKESLAYLNHQIATLSDEAQEALFTSLLAMEKLDARMRKRKQRALAQLRRWWEMFNGRI